MCLEHPDDEGILSRAIPSAEQLHDSHLHDIFHQHKETLTAKIVFTNVRVIARKLPGVTAKPTVNILSTDYDADHNTNVINLFDVTTVKAVNGVSISKVLSAALDDNGQSWNDIVALSSDSVEHLRCTVREIRLEVQTLCM